LGFFSAALPRLFSAWPGQSTGFLFWAVVDVVLVVVDVGDGAAVGGATGDGAVVGDVVVVRPVPDPEPVPDPV
jgi:hypothetical protein